MKKLKKLEKLKKLKPLLLSFIRTASINVQGDGFNFFNSYKFFNFFKKHYL